MFTNTLKGEISKIFNRVSTYLVPAIIGIILTLASWGLKTTSQNLDFNSTNYSSVYSFLFMTLLFYALFFGSVIYLYLIPCLNFAKDFKNNVIAKIISMGCSRRDLFVSKFLATAMQLILATIIIFIGPVIMVIVITYLDKSTLATIAYIFEDGGLSTLFGFLFFMALTNLLNFCIMMFSTILVKHAIGGLALGYAMISGLSVLFFMLLNVFSATTPITIYYIVYDLITIVLVAFFVFTSSVIFNRRNY